MRISPLDPAQRFTEEVASALRSHGHWVQLFHQARSHYAPVAGMKFADYLAQRPRALRELLDLHTRLLMQDGRGEFHFPCTPELLEDAWDTFCMVVDRAQLEDTQEGPDSLEYLRSAMTTAARENALRLGIFFA